MRCLIFKNRREETSTETPLCAITVMKVNPACVAEKAGGTPPRQSTDHDPPPPPSLRKP